MGVKLGRQREDGPPAAAGGEDGAVRVTLVTSTAVAADPVPQLRSLRVTQIPILRCDQLLCASVRILDHPYRVVWAAMPNGRQ